MGCNLMNAQFQTFNTLKSKYLGNQQDSKRNLIIKFYPAKQRGTKLNKIRQKTILIRLMYYLI